MGVLVVITGALATARPTRAEGPQRDAPAPSAEADLNAARRLDSEAEQQKLLGKAESAILVVQRALAIRERVLGQDHPDVGLTLSRLGELYEAAGEYARAERLYERAISILATALGPEHVAVATSLNSLAGLLVAKGDYARAEPLLLRAVDLQERGLGQDHPNLGLSLTNLALLYRKKGDLARAEPLNERAVAIVEGALGPHHPGVAASLTELAALCLDKGDYTRAEPPYQRALAIREKELGRRHPDTAVSLNNLASLYQAKGDPARAEPMLQRALSLLQAALQPDHPHIATSLNNLATLYSSKGDSSRAEPLYQKALAIREKVLGKDHPDAAEILNSLALIYQDRGELRRAERMLQRALAIQEKALGKDHPAIAASLNNQAHVYQAKGDYTRAEPMLQRALAIREKVLGVDHPSIAESLSSLAALYQDKGDYAVAAPLLQRALSIQKKALGPDHPRIAMTFSNIARMHAAEGHAEEAVGAAWEAIDIQDRNASALLMTGSEEQKRLYMATLVNQTHAFVSLHVQHAPSDVGAARLALTILLRRKGRVLDAVTDGLAALRRSLSRSDQALVSKLASIYSELATEASRGPGGASPEKYRRDLAALERDRQSLEAAVAQRSAAFRAEQRLLTLADVAAAIPEGAALVEIARYRPFNPRAEARSNPWGAPRYVAYVLHRSGDPTSADLGEAAPIDAAVEACRSALADHDRTHDPKPAARALDRLLMQPIRRLLEDRASAPAAAASTPSSSTDVRWVFVSPDGPLHLVPFGAMVDEGGRYLVERYLFSYLTTGRDLLRLSNEPAAPREPALVLADPAFGARSTSALPEGTYRGVRSLDMVNQELPPLESTAEEARAIRQLFPHTRVLLGTEATEGVVKAARAPGLLHLATHGFFLPEQTLPEVLLHGRPGDRPTPAERAALLERENPLLRSGVALAGFNGRRSGSDDGVLTALEVAALDLSGTRLVTLSTCESGVGQPSSGEGVYGLRRALVMAGAETQVMSLWQVDTGRTRELMAAYYKLLKRGAGRSEAMRDVQLAMLSSSKTAHPNLWASFIVSGDYRPMDARWPDIGEVGPGPRGCACGQAGDASRAHGAWSMIALGLAAVGRARRRRAALPAARIGDRADALPAVGENQ
jgi:CHAT domain-containing protein/Tfp pilus assembly protein PilF